MAGLDVSWTQDEWTEFLANECRIKRDNASQIASKLAEQDFQTGKFSRFVEEWKLNWEGCKGILLGIGFREMDIVLFIAALRRHISKYNNEKQTQTTMEIANRKRPMCNELVWAVCKGIGVVKTSDRILLTSANIYAYLEKAFRKKLIYRDGTNFIKANIWRKFSIAISQKDQNVGNEIMVIDQKQTESEYELWTNHLHIRMWKECDWSESKCSIDENALENAHVHFFLRLIAPQLRPIAIRLTFFNNSTLSSAARFLNKMHDCIDWVQLRKKQLSLEPISAMLDKCNKLVIYSLDRMDEDQLRQFFDAFIRWINTRNGGQPKMCDIDTPFKHEQILQLLDAINKDFVGATSKQPFAIRIEDAPEPLAEFTVRNARTREQLQLRRIGERRYMLMRQLAITELDNCYYQKKLEWEFDNVDKMFSIKIIRLHSDASDY